jgi:hypothetical protein
MGFCFRTLLWTRNGEGGKTVNKLGRPDHEATAFREDHHGKLGRRDRIVRGWRLCPLRHYGAAKSDIAHYTRYLAQDLGPLGKRPTVSPLA